MQAPPGVLPHNARSHPTEPAFGQDMTRCIRTAPLSTERRRSLSRPETDDNEAPEWKPSLRCACVLDRDIFAMVYGQLTYDDPFSIILIHDGSRSEPWRRIEVKREINAATAVLTPGAADTDHRFAFLSNEGDVYLVGSGIEHEKIEGAGIASPDASGHGALHAISAAPDGQLFAAGSGSQLYQRKAPGVWYRVNLPAMSEGDIGVAALHRLSNGAWLLVGATFMEADAYDVTSDPAYADDMSVDDLMRLFEQQANREGDRTPHGLALVMDEDGVHPLVAGDLPDLRAVCAEGKEIWAAGSEGLILQGTLGGAWQRTATIECATFLSAARFQGDTVLASEFGLHRLVGNDLHEFAPRIASPAEATTLAPWHVEAVGNALFCFDLGLGAFRLEGGNWSWIKTPAKLLVRDVHR